MKKKLLIISAVLIVMVGGVFIYLQTTKKETNQDAIRFSEEYETIPEDNLFVYKDINEIIQIMEKGTGVIYIGFPECPWCQAYLPMLDEVAKEIGLSKISYLNIKDDRSDNTEEYQQLVELLKEHLNYDSDGNERIYVPTVVSVVNGEVVGFNDETSLDLKGFTETEDYWSTDAKTALKEELEKMIHPVYQRECLSCNI